MWLSKIRGTFLAELPLVAASIQSFKGTHEIYIILFAYFLE